MRPPWIDADQNKPTHGVGFYPVSLCYDPEEGIFPTGNLWNGEAWETWAVCWFIDQKFDDKRSASDLAYEHDIEAQKRENPPTP